MRDLALDPATGDLALDPATGKMYLTSGFDAVRQKVLLRLGLGLGECVLDRSVGIPWLLGPNGSRGLLGTSASLLRAEDVLRRAITTCPGIAALDAFVLTLGRDRVARISFRARATSGEVLDVRDFSPGAP